MKHPAHIRIIFASAWAVACGPGQEPAEISPAGTGDGTFDATSALPRR